MRRDPTEGPTPSNARERLGDDVWSQLLEQGIDPAELAEGFSRHVVRGGLHLDDTPSHLDQFIEDTSYEYIWAYSMPSHPLDHHYELALTVTEFDEEVERWVSPYDFDIEAYEEQYPMFGSHPEVPIDEFGEWIESRGTIDGFTLVGVEERLLSKVLDSLTTNQRGVVRYRVRPGIVGSGYEVTWECLRVEGDGPDASFVPKTQLR